MESGITEAVTRNISKALDKVWHAGLLHELKSYGISSRINGFISSFLSNKRSRVVLDRKFAQEYPVDAGTPQGSILGPALFLLLYINDLPNYVICNNAIYTDDSTFYFKCDQGLVFELESTLRDTVSWGWKCLTDFSAGKTDLVWFDQSNIR